MLKRRYFGHVDPDGVGPDRHAQESGYALAGGISRQKSANTIESISLQAFKADGFLAQLVTDPNSPSKGHRMHLLGVGGFYAQARDIGVGLTRSGNVKAPGREFQPAFCVLHTGRTGSETAWVTGVAYADKNRNGAYDPGEGLEGVEVKGGERLVRSLKEGGYALPVPLVGELEITCEMGALHGYAKAKLALEGKNIHVEFLARKPEGVVNFGPAVAPAKKKE